VRWPPACKDMSPEECPLLEDVTKRTVKTVTVHDSDL
jgi:hypothetical protein